MKKGLQNYGRVSWEIWGLWGLVGKMVASRMHTVGDLVVIFMHLRAPRIS